MIWLDEITRAKIELRQKILNERLQIPPEVICHNSNLIIKKIKKLPEFKTSFIVLHRF